MMKKTRIAFALSVGLFLSAELGGNILSSDAFLWAAAPTHALGLVAFVGIDLLLITALWGGFRYAGTLCIVMAAVQFLAMAGDLAGLQPPSGMTASAFRNYLLGNILYVPLFALQPAIAALGLLFRRNRHASHLFPSFR